MKKSLQSKLMKYSLTAAAVVAAGANANAQVQYSGIKNQNVTSSYDIDLNNDQVADYTIAVNTTTYFPPSLTYTFQKKVYLNEKGSNEWVRTSRKVTTNYFVKAMSSGQVVSAANNWGANSMSFNMGVSTNGTSFYPNSLFIDQGDKYIGVKISLAKGTHYGWIRINVPSGTNNLTVKDWAFEQTAGKSIKTGQTTALNEVSSDNLNISFGPNPTTGYIKISADDNYKVEILDMAGKIVLSAQMESNKAEFDMSELQSGIYIAKLTNDKKTTSLKIVKE